MESCQTNLINLLDETTSGLDRGERVNVCCLDFEKAPDTIGDSLCDEKPKAFGLEIKVNKWIAQSEG